ncbi:MAG: NADH-quinone oxidoreductase subunit B, partial [Paludibacteraceae bacterium]|nr:NADH-quinone oxidoreductase subunit B [Paludibacteraceae bacterium]
MKIKSIHIKNIPNEEFKDNEYLEQYVEELKKNGTSVAVTKLSDLLNWGHSNSVWPLTFGTSCCAIEFMCVA